MIEFILNNKKVKTELVEGTTLWDYIRKGTSSCRDKNWMSRR